VADSEGPRDAPGTVGWPGWPRLLSRRLLRLYLGEISDDTLDRYVAAGILRPFPLPPGRQTSGRATSRRTVYDRLEIDRWLATLRGDDDDGEPTPLQLARARREAADAQVPRRRRGRHEAETAP
jgi:hypothetical protein